MQKHDTVVPDVCEGIGEDLQALLKAFEKKRSLRFQKFLEVAIEYDLKNVYAGRLNVAEYIEFAENFMRSAFVYASPGNPSAPRNIVERVFGIYITYYLYCAQATDYHVKIYTTTNDVNELLNFIKSVLLPQRHLDAVGCIHKLVYDDAFTIGPFQKDFDHVCHKRWDSTADRDGKDLEDKKYVPLQEANTLMEDPLFKTMVRVQKKIKQTANIIPNLAVSNIVEEGDDFIQRMQKHLTELRRRIKDVDHAVDTVEAQDDPSAVTEDEPYEVDETSRILLKEKAYHSNVVYRRDVYADLWNKQKINKEMMEESHIRNDLGDEPLHAVKEEPLPTKAIGMASAKRSAAVKISEIKVGDSQVSAAKGADKENMAEPSTHTRNKKSKKRRSKLTKKRVTNVGAVDNVEEILEMKVDDVGDRGGLPAKPKLDADFEANLRSLENLVKGPDSRRLAAFGVLE